MSHDQSSYVVLSYGEDILTLSLALLAITER